ncbi:hypothetical protein F4805DRAFT_205577 [Annulohypoxylon moriforme]|nr:hypothetical protein F4805DRAFT_205577 [Annulohypoxylon moriforme]
MVFIGTITNEAYLGVGIFMTVLVAVFIVLRIITSIRQFKKLLLDDCLSLTGFAILIGYYVLEEFEYRSFYVETSWPNSINTGIAIPILAAFSLWTSKSPILVLYVRLFGVKRWMRYACYMVIVISALGFIGSLVPALTQCRPFDRADLRSTWVRCGAANVNSSVIAGTVSVAADLCILLLPLRPIYLLNLSRSRKIGLGIVFCSGIFGVLASVLSLVYKINLFLGARIDSGCVLATMLLQFVECAIALMVGCVPAIRGFWKGFVEPSKFYNSIGSFGTRIVSKVLTRTSSSNTKPKSEYHDHDYEMDKFRPMGSVNFHDTNDAYILAEFAGGSRRDINQLQN